MIFGGCFFRWSVVKNSMRKVDKIVKFQAIWKKNMTPKLKITFLSKSFRVTAWQKIKIILFYEPLRLDSSKRYRNLELRNPWINNNNNKKIRILCLKIQLLPITLSFLFNLKKMFSSVCFLSIGIIVTAFLRHKMNCLQILRLKTSYLIYFDV